MGIEDQLAKSGDAMRSHAESSTVPAASVVLARAQRRRRIGAGVVAGVVLLGLGGTAMALRPEPTSQIAITSDTTDPGSTTAAAPTTWQRPPTTPMGPETTTTVVPEVSVVPPTTADTTITFETGPTLHTVPDTTDPQTSVPDTTVPETTVPETTMPATTVPNTTVWETTTTPHFVNQDIQLDVNVTAVNSTKLRVVVSGRDPDAPINIDAGSCGANRIDVRRADGSPVSSHYFDGTDVTGQPICAMSLIAVTPTSPSPCEPNCGSADRSVDVKVGGPGTYSVQVIVTSYGDDPSGRLTGYMSYTTVTKNVTVPA